MVMSNSADSDIAIKSNTRWNKNNSGQSYKDITLSNRQSGEGAGNRSSPALNSNKAKFNSKN